MSNGLSPNGNPVRMGTISHGTLRMQDLLRTFADEIVYLGWHNGTGLVTQARDLAEILDGNPDSQDHEIASSILEELTEALNRACPLGVYFGTLEGDGSDFGFWQIDDESDSE